MAYVQDDIKELKRQLKLHTHQTGQMMEELSFKEATIAKVNIDKIGVEKEVAKLVVRCIKYTRNLTSDGRM